MTTRAVLGMAVLAIAMSAGGCKKKSDKKNAAPTPPPVVETPPMPPPTSWTLGEVGFATPESVLHDAEADVYLVSNINGSPAGKDGNGFISRVSPDKVELAELKWIDGAADGVTLDAPKGMALLGDTLYVADLDAVRMFDRKTGAPKGEVTIKGATFLNDVAVGNGSVFVTDTGVKPDFSPSGSAAVYEIKDGKATRVIAGDELGLPNGVVVEGDALVVVSFGSGEFYKVVGGKKTDAAKLIHGQLDGIEPMGDGTFLVSSWEGSEVLQGGGTTEWKQIVGGVETPADIGLDRKRKRLLIPLFKGDAVRVEQL